MAIRGISILFLDLERGMGWDMEWGGVKGKIFFRVGHDSQKVINLTTLYQKVFLDITHIGVGCVCVGRVVCLELIWGK